MSQRSHIEVGGWGARHYDLMMVKLMEEPAAKFGEVCREYRRNAPMFDLRPDYLRLLRTPGL
jgi:hypothetical protein